MGHAGTLTIDLPEPSVPPADPTPAPNGKAPATHGSDPSIDPSDATPTNIVADARKPGLVLVVDPDHDVLRSTTLLIEALGYDVEGLSDAPDILDAVHKHRPTLLLQETQMPGLNIAGLMASLRSDPTTSNVKVAFFSAVLDLAATAQRHQAWSHLSKPFGFQELAHLLERALGPPPGKVALEVSRDVEKEIRLAFREYRNLLAALNNYVVLLEKGGDLNPPAKAAVERVQDLILMMEARTVRLRSYILSLVGPAEALPAAAAISVPQQPAFERVSRASKPLAVHGRLGRRVDVAAR